MRRRKSNCTIVRTALAFVCRLAIVVLGLAVCLSTITRADGCPSTKDEITTDRPDVTNSSLVVPAGSLQIENGVNFSTRDGDRFVDGTNTRLRSGIANCLEFLVDTPTYFANVQGPKIPGFPMSRQR